MSEINYNSFVYDLPDKRNKRLEPHTICFSIFFDGTLNNKKNIEARVIYEEHKNKEDEIPKYSDFETKTKTETYIAYEAYKKNKGGENSYNNDYSNVARLFKSAIRKEFQLIPIYLEGPGSHEYSKDDIIDGAAFGRGSNGIRARIKEACRSISEEVSEINTYLNNNDKEVNKIIFDVYGFSRGAAAARNFIHEVTQYKGIENEYLPFDKNAVDFQPYCDVSDKVKPFGFLGYFLKEQNINVEDIIINIRFVGIFDTVSSYSPKFHLNPDFNDVNELHLDAVSKARNVVHLTAADEHRKNFALTTIKATATGDLKGKYAVEISLPGVHSDIGGGYRDKIDEKKEVMDIDNCPEFKYETRNIKGYGIKGNRIKKLEYERCKLINEGWFTWNDKYELNPYWGELIFERKQINNQYSYIPLLLMYQFCSIYTTFKNDIPEKYKIRDNSFQNKKIIEKMIDSRFQLWFYDGKKRESNFVNDWKNSLENEIELLFRDNKEIIILASDSYYEPLCLAKEWFIKENYNDIKKIQYKTASNIINRYNSISDIQNNLQEIKEEIIDQIYLRHLRHDFLHWSSDFKGTVIGGVETAIMPHEPRYLNGKRTREIILG